MRCWPIASFVKRSEVRARNVGRGLIRRIRNQRASSFVSRTRLLIAFGLAGCNSEVAADKAAEIANPQVTIGTKASRNEVENANRCLGLVQALETVKRSASPELLSKLSLAGTNPETHVKMLRAAEDVEARSGLPRSTLAEIQQRSFISIRDEAELERLAPEVQRCLATK
jgi:hypothetical protein